MSVIRVSIALIGAIIFAWPITSNASLTDTVCKASGWIPHDFNSVGHCVSEINTGAVMAWNLYEDFKFYPYHQNPSPDQYDNPNVWHYRYSLVPIHIPALYVHFTDYFTEYVDNIEGWGTTTSPPYAPFLGAAPGDDESMIVIHPSESHPTMASWQSPINGSITINGHIGDRDPTCGEGITWSIERETSTGESLVLMQGPLRRPSVDVSDFIYFGLRVTVTTGDFIDFIINRGLGGDACDLTAIHLSIVGRPD